MGSALRRQGVRRIVLAEACSGLGDGIFWVGLVTEMSHRGAGVGWYSLAAVARLGPRAAFGTAAGALADRLDRRAVLVLLDLSRALTMMILAVMVQRHVGLGAMILMVLVTYTLAAPYRPALTSALPLVTPERELGAASALLGTVRQALTFLGPLAGVVLLSTAGPSWAVAANGITFLLSAVLIAGIRLLRTSGEERQQRITVLASRHSARPQRSEIDRRTEVLIGSVVFAMYLIRGAELMLHVLLAEQQLGLGARGVGYLAGAIGLGALAAMPFGTRFAETDRPSRMLTTSLLLNAVPLVLLSAVHAPAVAAALLFVQGFTLVAFEVVTITLVQRLTPSASLGRAFGQINAASNAGRLIGVLATLLAVNALGLDTSMILLGSLVVLAAALTVSGLVELGHRSLDQRRSLQSVVDVLATSALFEGVSAASLERAAASVEPVEFAAHDVVIREGDDADAVYLARAGTFDVSVGGDVINRMTAGDWFGEIGIIHRRPRTATVTATSDATVWRVPGASFLDALEDAAAPPTAMLEGMAERLRRSDAGR
jgi:predicted MFS family arabinose efflux permease